MFIVDDKSQYCIPFIKECITAFADLHQNEHAASSPSPPFFLGINGIQGAGKTTFVNSLRSNLSSPPLNYRTISFSLDDLYLTHAEQLSLARSHSSNPLLQHRGQPGTHDIPLAEHIIRQLKANQPVTIPVYDKSAFNGEGDRCHDESRWIQLNNKGDPPLNVVILEGWCLGFRKRPDEEIIEDWKNAVRMVQESSRPDYHHRDGKHSYNGRLGHVQLDHILAINHVLDAYDVLTE
ncbi:hypothetical protein KEM54_005018 [Ascosphaera aggregata]|nr:hypothetical protein KEM54_005018 [Ascosphaera aggregata]